MYKKASPTASVNSAYCSHFKSPPQEKHVQKDK